MRDPATIPIPPSELVSSPPTPTQSLSSTQPISPVSSKGTARPSDPAQAAEELPMLIFPLPKLRLEVRDLNHDGARTFLSSVNASKALASCVQSALTLLYLSPTSQTTTPPQTRSVTVVLRAMPGVAYTTGSDLDSDHKEIHMSLDYIHAIEASRSTNEILGVLTHEMVHCFQHNAFGTCPGGLIEGIADWIRLTAGLSAPHWKKVAGQKWDAGYEHTGYFLEYLVTRFGGDLVRRLNEKLRIARYTEKQFWTELCGRPVDQLWEDYQKVVEKEIKMEEDCVLVNKEDAVMPGAANSKQ